MIAMHWEREGDILQCIERERERERERRGNALQCREREKGTLYNRLRERYSTPASPKIFTTRF